MKKTLLSLLLLSLTVYLQAQPPNEDCSTAIVIDDPTAWCSNIGQYTNEMATASGYGEASCWNSSGINDVWFEFTSFFTDIVITVIGDINVGQDGGTLSEPQVALYTGTCGGTINQLQCGTDPGGQGIIEINRGGLTLGERYYIRVDGRSGMGTFQLCVNNFNPPVDPGQDCVLGAVLCDKSPFSVQLLTGGGLDNDEAANSCIGGIGFSSEQQSSWYRWTAANDGTLTFTISPINPSDDIDFVLYELPSSIDICSDKQVIRCMATACSGPTGLNSTSTDLEEDLNCDPGEDGFIKEITMIAGKSYALLINNFSNTGNGYSLEFGGTGEFLGPEAAFTITPESGLRCEEDFVVTDASTFANGQITNWNWNFGEGAVPQTATGQGPHNVIYNSIGTKFITMTIETDIGCIVTDVRQLEAEACCEDIATLEAELVEKIDLLCFGIPTGEISVGANGGTPGYKFSINGSEFRDIIRFQSLDAGDHEIKAIDAHGCRDSFIVSLTQPEEILVDVGADREVQLGSSVIVNTIVTPVNSYTYLWCPSEGVSDTASAQVTILPLRETVYTVKVENDMGCIGTDSLRIRVDDHRPVYIPNVFSPNGDGLNDEFVIFTNNATHNLEYMRIYDRWGDLVYDSAKIPSGSGLFGWNGTFKGQKLSPAVYIVVAKVNFIDGESSILSSDLTLIR